MCDLRADPQDVRQLALTPGTRQEMGSGSRDSLVKKHRPQVLVQVRARAFWQRRLRYLDPDPVPAGGPIAARLCLCRVRCALTIGIIDGEAVAGVVWVARRVGDPVVHAAIACGGGGRGRTDHGGFARHWARGGNGKSINGAGVGGAGGQRAGRAGNRSLGVRGGEVGGLFVALTGRQTESKHRHKRNDNNTNNNSSNPRQQ